MVASKRKAPDEMSVLGKVKSVLFRLQALPSSTTRQLVMSVQTPQGL